MGAVSAMYALGRAHPRIAEESIASVVVPACAECFCLGLGMLICVAYDSATQGIPSAFWLLVDLLSVAAACLFWAPVAFVRSVYFAWATLAFVKLARERTLLFATAAALMLVLGCALSLGSVRIVPAECSQVLPSQLVAAVARW